MQAPSIVQIGWKHNFTWWRHQMETFPALLALCAGNSPGPVNSLHKGQWRGALVFSLMCARINDRVNNRETGDSTHHRGHYDVNVMNFFVRNRPISLVEGCIHYQWRNIVSEPSAIESRTYVENITTATSSDRRGISNYRWVDCLFNSLFRPTTKKHQMSALLSFLEKSTGHRLISHTRGQ